MLHKILFDFHQSIKEIGEKEIENKGEGSFFLVSDAYLRLSGGYICPVGLEKGCSC